MSTPPTIERTTHRDLTLSEINAERARAAEPSNYDRREVETEFAMGGPNRPAAPRRDHAANRAATEHERHLLRKFGSPVRLDTASAPAQPIRLPIDDTPPSRPPRPAAIRPAAIRPLQIARPDRSPLEAAAESMYDHLTHDARVLLRLLDTAGAPLAPTDRFWSVAFIELVQAFNADGLDRWEAEARLWNAIHELKRWDIAEIIPGQHRAMEALFVSAHEDRRMLAPRVLHTPHAITLCPIADAVILNAKASLAA